MDRNANGVHGLAELPVGKMRGTAEGIEEGLGAFGGSVAKSFVPCFGPADVVVASGGFDGQRVEALKEMLAGRGFRPTVGWGAWWW